MTLFDDIAGVFTGGSSVSVPMKTQSVVNFPVGPQATEYPHQQTPGSSALPSGIGLSQNMIIIGVFGIVLIYILVK